MRKKYHHFHSKTVQKSASLLCSLFFTTTSQASRLSDTFEPLSPVSQKISASNHFSPTDQLILLDDDLLPSYSHDSTSPHIYTVTSKYFYSNEDQDVCLYFTNFPDLEANQHFKISASLTGYTRPTSSWNYNSQTSQSSKTAQVIFVKKIKQRLGNKRCFKIKIPEVESGIFTLNFSVKYGTDSEVSAENLVKIRPSFPVVFITTDKPIYKPGQIVNYKILVLDRYMLGRLRSTHYCEFLKSHYDLK